MSPLDTSTPTWAMSDRMTAIEVTDGHRAREMVALWKKHDKISDRLSDLEAQWRKALMAVALAIGSLFTHNPELSHTILKAVGLGGG